MKKFILPVVVIVLIGFALAWQISNGMTARAQGDPGELKQAPAETASEGEPTRIVVPMTDHPPIYLSKALNNGVDLSDDTWMDIPTLPPGDSAVMRADSVPSSEADSYIAEAIDITRQTNQAPGDMVLFRHTKISSESLGGMTRVIGSPSVTNNGYIIFQTGELYAALSADGGRTFKYIDPATAFPASFGGFCCNQVVIYVPSRDMFIWELEYSPSQTQGGALRIAISRGEDILDGVWYYYDLVASTGHFFNYSDLSLSNDFLYVTTNGFENAGSWTNSYVYRFPLDALLGGGAISYELIELHQFGPRAVHGATDVIYWAAHNTTSQVRVYKWEEDADAAVYADINLSAAWFDDDRDCPGPDGKNWCGGMGEAGRILTGWVARGVIGFMWGSSQGGSFPYPYIEAVTINASNLTYLGRPYIKSNNFAFIYPGADVNARGDVAVVFNYGGGNLYPSVGYAVADDFTTPPPEWTFYPGGSSTQGPNNNNYGRYNTVRAFTPTRLVWSASGYILNGCGDNGCAEPLFFIFGRERDMRSLTHYWGLSYGTFVPFIKK